MNKKTLNQVNQVLVCSLAIIYLAYLSSMRNHILIELLVAIFIGCYLLTKKSLSSMIIAIIIVLSMEIIFKQCETWDIDTNITTGNSINTQYDVVENFKGSSKKKRKQIVEDVDDDDVEESYMDLGTSFLEAYKSLTPEQIKQMSRDTRS